jgi:hypothetical protein
MFKSPLINSNGITIKELKEIVKDLPEVDEYNGEDYEVWMDDGNGYSNVVTSIYRLNQGDIILKRNES